MSHSAEIIAVGTELLLGNITNTNARDISRALSAVGVNVFWHTVVGDNPERLRAALDIARNRADIIITTGGLGPTYDDLTKQTVCAAFGKPLVLRENVLEGIRAYFARNVHLTMPENNRQQAEFPADCVIFDNPVGTAPGCAFEAEGTHVLMLPGPPFEMLTMLRDYAVPYLRSLSREVILSHDIMTFGMGESAIEELMREKIARMENPSLATYARPSEVRLRATAKAENAEAAEALLAPVRTGSRAHHGAAGGLRGVPGRRGELLDAGEGGRAGNRFGAAKGIRRGVGALCPGHGGKCPPHYRGGTGGVRHRCGGAGRR